MSDHPTFPYATVVEALFAQADKQPDSLAYAVDDDRITFGALRDDALALAAALDARGVGRGDRCALVLGTAIDTVCALYAVQIAGAAPVVINPAQPAAGLHRRLRMVRPKLAIFEDDGPIESGGVPFDVIRNEGRQGWHPAALPAPADTAYLQVTSGTTGEPKAGTNKWIRRNFERQCRKRVIVIRVPLTFRAVFVDALDRGNIDRCGHIVNDRVQ